MITKDDKITLNDDNIFYLDGKKRKDSGTWSKEGQTLRLVSSDMTLTLIITELTTAKLSMYGYIYGHTLKFTFVRI